MAPGSVVLELPDPELLPLEDSVLGSTSVVDEDELVAALDDPVLLEDPSVPEPPPSPSQPPSSNTPKRQETTTRRHEAELIESLSVATAENVAPVSEA